MKKYLKILFRAGVLAAIAVLAFFAYQRSARMSSAGVNIHIDYDGRQPLFDKTDIRRLITRKFDTLTGKRLKTLPLEEIERFLNGIPGIKNADVYTTLTGKVGIDIQQRFPVAILFTEGDKSFFMDGEGFVYEPVFKTYPKVTVINGSIPRNIGDTGRYNEELRAKLTFLLQTVNKNDFLKNLVDEIYVVTKNEFEFVPKIGHHIIRLGDTNGIAEKVEKLELFYAQGISPSGGWRKYKTVDLRFKDQVVCSK